jgi:mono/diheme cytochrome c family protein
VSDQSAPRQPVIMAASGCSGHVFALLRLIIPVILVTASIVAPLAAGPGDPADPKAREVAPESASQAPERLSSSYPPATIAQFRDKCVDCHDSNGRGESGREIAQGIPDFTDLRWQRSRTDEVLRRSILEGKGGTMPAMRSKIKPDDANRLVSLVRGFGGGRLVIPDQPEDGPAPSRPVAPSTDKIARSEASSKASEASKREFQVSCRKCHGADGKGDSLRGSIATIPDFTNPQWQQSTSKAQLTASILEGKGTHMPGFRSRLGPKQVDDLVAQVRAFAPTLGDSIESQPEDLERQLTDLRKEFDDLRRAYRELSPLPSPKRN